MSIIAGVTVAWSLSPRIITIPAPVTEVTIEDLQDTLLALEDTDEGMVWLHLRNTSGGEALGGGVTVGLTMEMQDAQIAFEERYTPDSSGTATGVGTTTLTDGTLGTFITDSVVRGAMILNYTDGSVATVISITSEGLLTHTALKGGTNNDWSVSDSYDIINEVQCSIVGGNLVAVDNVLAELDPVFPTVGTQVIRTSASSATTANQAALLRGTFNGGIYWDDLIGKASITDAAVDGNEENPLLNLTDVIIQAEALEFSLIHVVSTTSTVRDKILDGSLDNYQMNGVSRASTNVTFEDNSDTGDMGFRDIAFTGIMNGGLFADNCDIGDISEIGCTTNDTTIINSTIGSIVWRADNTKDFSIINCNAGTETTVLDFNGTVADVSIQNWAGDIELRNLTDLNMTVDFTGVGGLITIKDTCTAGIITLNGNGGLDDQSNGTVVNSDDLINKALLVDLTNLVSELREENPTTQEITKKVWSEDLTEYDEEEAAGFLLVSSAEAIESTLAADLAAAVWKQDMTGAFGPNTAGGILKKTKLIYKILVS